MPDIAAATASGSLSIDNDDRPCVCAFICDSMCNVQCGCSTFRQLDSWNIEQLAQL